MISLTRLDRSILYLNPDLIEHMESTPDTVVAMSNGQRFMVRETAEAVVEKVIEFRRRVLLGPVRAPEDGGGAHRASGADVPASRAAQREPGQ